MKTWYADFGDISMFYGSRKTVGALDTLPIYIERRNESGGFDFAEGLAPQCTFQRSCGFSEEELFGLAGLVRNNLLLLFRDSDVSEARQAAMPA
jgi:hypothetical protein